MTADRKSLMATLETARRIAAEMTDGGADPKTVADALAVEGRKIQQASAALVLAFISDEPTPISLFKSWASYSQFRIWEGERLLKLSRRNRKVCCVPSEFFALWRRIKDKPKTKN